MSYQARTTSPSQMVTALSGAWGKIKRTAKSSARSSLVNDRLEVVTVRSKAVKPDNRRPRERRRPSFNAFKQFITHMISSNK